MNSQNVPIARQRAIRQSNLLVLTTMSNVNHGNHSPYNHLKTAIHKAVPLLLTIMLLLSAAVLRAEPSSAVQSTGLAEQVGGADSSSSGFVAGVLRWYDAHMNYSAVGLLMTLESSFVPFPSEVVIPPATFVASNPQNTNGMKIWLIVLIGTLGAMLGAYINYYLSRWLGRPVIYAFVNSKVGHMLMLSSEKMERAEAYFNKHGNVSTLVGRLVPVVRQLISIPAGLSKMNIVAFSLYTFIGALIWNTILAAIGVAAYRAGSLEIINRYSHELSVALVIIVVLAALWFVMRALRKKRSRSSATE